LRVKAFAADFGSAALTVRRSRTSHPACFSTNQSVQSVFILGKQLFGSAAMRVLAAQDRMMALARIHATETWKD